MSNKKSIENWDDFKESLKDDKQEIKDSIDEALENFLPPVKQEIKNIKESIANAVLNFKDNISEEVEDDLIKCSNCGKENQASIKFCPGCGKAIQENQDVHSTQNIRENECKRGENSKKGLVIIGIIIAICIIIRLFSGASDDVEYTNNSSDKLPIVVNSVYTQENFYTTELTLKIKNGTDIDYKNATFAVLAWDKEGLPIKLVGTYDFSFEEKEYITYLKCENIGSYELQNSTYSFESADIAYLSVFLVEYTDYDNQEWENPILDFVEEMQGNKLSETEIYYFEFQ